MKLLAIVVTYYPNEELLKKNVNAFIDYVEELIIWENTNCVDAPNYRYVHNNKTKYMSCGENSISKALNTAWHYAETKGYDALLTMDQDSCFLDFCTYKKWAERTIMETSSICAPFYNERHNDGRIVEKLHVITSGMIVPLYILNMVNGYCESFAVDAIDIDICNKARNKGFKVFQNSSCCLMHNFGTPYKKTVLGHEFCGLNYPPHRIKGIFRNFIICYRQNNHPDYLLKEIHWNYANYIPNILFCEKNKIKKLLAIIAGTISGLTFKIKDDNKPIEEEFHE